jgi:SAM-dependent methyltransferase
MAAAGALEGARVLDVGCGVGLYASRMEQAGAWVVGTEVEWPRALEARSVASRVVAARAEQLPFAAATFQTVVLHEVLEHVADDRRALQEVARVLVGGGRAVVFVPNRLWPFETHGMYWRGRYRFGNVPLVNYLPDVVRDRLVPHARAYTRSGLLDLVGGLPLVVIAHRQVFPGFDRLAAGHPALGRLAKAAVRLLEPTPLSALGLSHFLVLERTACQPPRG